MKKIKIFNIFLMLLSITISLNAYSKADQCSETTAFLNPPIDPTIFPVAHGILIFPWDTHEILRFEGSLAGVPSPTFHVMTAAANLHGHGWMHPPAQEGQEILGVSIFVAFQDFNGFPILVPVDGTANWCIPWGIPEGFFLE
ncbi:MAG: hypothetical protein RQ899_07530 [Pseudomonadales bacterium]|nr:hypothetical protein [Pseudomonadales bacterium]